MNAMSIQQVAAAEEFATQIPSQGDPCSGSPDRTPMNQAEQQNTPMASATMDLGASIQKSLESVGSGIQTLLSESLTLATGDVTTELQATVQQHVQAAIRKSLPTLSQQVQKEARKIAAVHAEQIAKKTTTAYVSDIMALVQQQNEVHQHATESITTRLDQVVSQNSALKQSNEEQRKVIVALVRKVGALETHATAASRHQQKTDQRLTRVEQPSDLNAEWQDVMADKGKRSADETDSAA